VTGYDALVELAERELDAVRGGDLDRLADLHAERHALLGTLPAAPPVSARPALERAAATQARVTAALEEQMLEAGGELRRTSHARTAMAGYAPQAERAKLVDRAG
jgi:hypothetical protein